MLTFMRKHAGKILIITVAFFILSIEIPFIYGRGAKRDTKQFMKREFNSQDIAFVDNKPINTRKFVQLVNQQLNQLTPPQQKSPLDPRIRSQVMYAALLQTIDYTLMLREAKRQRIGVSWGDVNREVDGVKASYKVADNNQFKELLKQNGYTLSQFKQMIREELMVQKLLKKIQGDLVITPDDIKNRFKKVKARHILIKTEYGNSGDKVSSVRKADEAALRQADELYKRLLKGADFGALAKEFSADTKSAERNGELGWFAQGQMVPEFEEAAFAMKPGEISKPVKTVFGYHIIKVEEVKQGEVPIDIDEEELKKTMIEERKRQRMDNWYRQILKKADVEVVARPMLAFKYKMEGDYEKALREYRLLAAENPADPSGQLFIGEIYEMMGNLAEANAEYQRALLKIKVNRSLENPFIHMAMGALLMKRGERSTAVKEFLKTEELLGDNLVGYDSLRRLYEKYGYPDEARRMARKIDQLKVLFSSDLEKDLELNKTKPQTPATAPTPKPETAVAKPQAADEKNELDLPPIPEKPAESVSPAAQ